MSVLDIRPGAPIEKAARALYGSVRSHPYGYTMAGGTLGAGVVGVAMAGLAYQNAGRQIGASVTNDYMTNLMMKVQSGPFGPSGALSGMKSRDSGTAGLTLATHYARNRNKYFGLLGLRYL